MADLDDFFAKKDKKKKTKKGFSKANTDVLAKNLEINEKKEQQADFLKHIEQNQKNKEREGEGSIQSSNIADSNPALFRALTNKASQFSNFCRSLSK